MHKRPSYYKNEVVYNYICLSFYNANTTKPISMKCCSGMADTPGSDRPTVFFVSIYFPFQDYASCIDVTTCKIIV